jgi:sugar (pentulose or hexulose) kinase
VGAGVWSCVDEACDKAVRVAQRVPHDTARAAKMKQRYAEYRKLYSALRESFHHAKA